MCDTKVENGIMVTTNTYDPSLFNTSINNELVYRFYYLKEKGYAKEVAACREYMKQYLM